MLTNEDLIHECDLYKTWAATMGIAPREQIKRLINDGREKNAEIERLKTERNTFEQVSETMISHAGEWREQLKLLSAKLDKVMEA